MSHSQDKPREFEAGVQKVKEFWNCKAQRDATDCAKVDSNHRTQSMRFAAFLTQQNINGKSILDVGCGTGDLFDYLRAGGVTCEYLGVDISEEMVRLCRQRHPDVRFECVNILDHDFQRTFDYTIAIGIHNNVRLSCGRELLEAVTRRQFELCTIAAHVSILTDRYQGFAADRQSWHAEDILTLALEITPYVVLRHDYLPNDFSVTLYREPLIDTRRDLIV